MDLTETNAASRSAAICLEDVCVTYRRGDIFVSAVRGVNLEIMVDRGAQWDDRRY